MKKGLSVVLGMVLVFAVSAVSLAMNVNGNLKTMYDFEVDDSDGSKSQDKGELKIYFDGKLADTITTRVTLKGYLDSKSDGDRAKPYNYIDEYYVNYPTNFGTFKLGKWGFKPKGRVDVVDTAFGDFKAEWALLYTYAFTNGFKLGMWIVPDRSNVGEVVGDGAYVATLGWANKAIDIEANLVDTGNEDDILVLKTGSGGVNKKAQKLTSAFGEGTRLGYTANITLNKFYPLVQPYLHYSRNDIRGELNDDRWIVGSRVKTGAWDLTLEYGLDDEYVDGATVYTDADNAFGWKVKYTFANALNLEWKYLDYGYNDKKKNELALNIPLK